MEGSPRNNLSKDEFKDWMFGLLIYVAAAALGYASEHVKELDLGFYGPIAATAIAAAIVFLKKFMSNTDKPSKNPGTIFPSQPNPVRPGNDDPTDPPVNRPDSPNRPSF